MDSRGELNLGPFFKHPLCIVVLWDLSHCEVTNFYPKILISGTISETFPVGAVDSCVC